MLARLISLDVKDIRFPTSRELDGSDAMNRDPDYSAAYVTLATDGGPDGHGFAFTIGRGNEVQAAAIRALAPHVVGREVEGICADLGGFYLELVDDSQLRWLGPEKGAMHMAIGAVVNAAWDLAAKRARRPVWKFLADMSPDELVALVDWRYLTDVLSPDEALGLLQSRVAGRRDREAALLADGYPGYATSPGWLGYPDEKLRRLASQAVEAGFSQIKLKVGASLDDDVRRLRIAREAVGPGTRIAIDANQRWSVPEAIAWLKPLREFEPCWIEEPTSPDDVLGHAAVRRAVVPIRVATGEHVQNRVVFKQLLQAEAIDVLQLDACRVGGVNENVAILLLAAKHGVPVCPHAGGVGLCELVQHLAMFDYVAVSGSLEERSIEYVDHLHDHFVEPVVVRDGRYVAPTRPGFGAEMHAETLAAYRYPDGEVWAERDVGGVVAPARPGGSPASS
jgi:L-fuconate dehydratase